MSAARPFAGIYLNLDRSTERRAAPEAQLRERGLDFSQRYSAIDGTTLPAAPPLTPGELGCLRSHLAALEHAASQTTPTHILEDDILLSRRLASDAARIVQSGVLDRFDIVFTDTLVQVDVPAIGMLLKTFDAASTAVKQGFHL